MAETKPSRRKVYYLRLEGEILYRDDGRQIFIYATESEAYLLNASCNKKYSWVPAI